jgi:AraC-like DNA-binding protein
MESQGVSMVIDQIVRLSDCRIETRTVEWLARDYVYFFPDLCSFSLTLGVQRGHDPGLWRIGGDAHAIETGHCGAVEAKTGVHVRLSPGTRRTVVCSVDTARFHHLTGIAGGWLEPRFLAKLQHDDSGPRRALIAIAQEMATPRFARDIALEGHSLVLLSEIGRIFVGAADPKPARNLSDKQLFLLRGMIDAKMGNGLNIAALASALGMSRRHLARAFRATFGRTLRDYVEDARLQRVMELLTETALPLKVIAAQVGLSNANYLSTAFRRRSGLTPGAYRQLTRQSRLFYSAPPTTQ